jgi:RHS repeat-associated protein
MLVEYIYLGDQLLAMIKPGDLAYYFHNDHLGTPQILTDDTQTIAWKAVYTPFGDAVTSIQTVENPFRFPGQYYDPETGLHYNYIRYYSPQTGRYITPDPIGLEGGINLFVYVKNNPIVLIDPTGEVDCVYSITVRVLTCETTCDKKIISCYAESGNNNLNDQCEKYKGPIPIGDWRIETPNSSGWAELTELPGNSNAKCNPKRTGLYIDGWPKPDKKWGCIGIYLNTCRDEIMNALRKEGGGLLEVIQ